VPKLPNVLVLLSPVFIGLAGWTSDLAVKYLPGHPHLDKSGLAAVFIAGAAFAFGHLVVLVHHTAKPKPPAAPSAAPPAAIAPPRSRAKRT